MRLFRRWFVRLGGWSKAVRADLSALWRAARDPRVPWPAKAVAFAVLAYALSPIDLIPDFIPVLGLLDDVIVVPLGIWLAIRLIPRPLWTEHRAAAGPAPPESRAGIALVLALWLLGLLALGWAVFGWLLPA